MSELKKKVRTNVPPPPTSRQLELRNIEVRKMEGAMADSQAPATTGREETNGVEAGVKVSSQATGSRVFLCQNSNRILTFF
jgi:hypothetical protein